MLAPQLQRLDEDTCLRADNVRRLLAATRGNQALIAASHGDPTAAEGRQGNHRPTCSAYYKLGWTLQASASRRSREELVAAAHAEGVALDAGFRGFTRRSSRRCRTAAPLKNAERAASSTVLLHHPILLCDRETIVRLAATLQRLDRWLQR